MAGNKYLQLSTGGELQEVISTQTSAGGANANQIVSLNASGVLDTTLFPAGIGADALSVTASEAISAGSFVNLWLNSAALNVRNADNTGGVGKRADGFALNAISSAANGTVTFSGFNTGQTGLTIATDYFLGTAGAPTTTLPTTTGYIVQKLGKAVSATAIHFQAYPPVIRA